MSLSSGISGSSMLDQMSKVVTFGARNIQNGVRLRSNDLHVTVFMLVRRFANGQSSFSACNISGAMAIVFFCIFSSGDH